MAWLLALAAALAFQRESPHLKNIREAKRDADRGEADSGITIS